MTALPILFDFSASVIGKGFATVVSFQGAALFQKEAEDEYWADGVYPCAVAAGGSTMQESYLKLKENLNKTLLDMASQYGSYEAFKEAMTKFYYELDAETERAFEAARDAVRQGRVESDLRRVDRPKFGIRFTAYSCEPGQLKPNTLVASEESLAA